MKIFNPFIPVNDYNLRAQMTDFACRWIALSIPSFSSQSESVNNAIHCFSLYY